MNETTEETEEKKISTPLEAGLYTFDGKSFTKLEPTEGKRVPISEEAFETLKEFRREIQSTTNVRLDLRVIVSGIVRFAAVSHLNGNEDAFKAIRDFAREDLERQAKSLL